MQKRGYRRESWSYAKLQRFAMKCALEFKNRGVQTGDRVLIWGPNSAEWLIAFWACLLRGAVAVPLDDSGTTEFASRVARETRAKLVASSRVKPKFDADVHTITLEDLPDVLRRPYLHGAQQIPGEAAEHIWEALADEPVTRDHVAEILFTSGTTSEPKGVVLTHGNFLANLEPLERGIDPYRKYERVFHPLRFVTVVPLSHVFGQFMGIFVPPLLGSAVVFENSTNSAEMIRTAKRERATAVVAVPHMLELLKDSLVRDLQARRRGGWLDRAFTVAEGRPFLKRAWMFRNIHRRFGWKFWAFIVGGAALDEETETFFRRAGFAVVQGYGMTETASLVSLNHPFRAAQGTIGKVLPGREFRIAPDGEILVRGENVASGYWQRGSLERTVRCEPDGDRVWLHTGDLAEIDSEGNLRFRGRKKNVIVTPAGVNVYPEDLEAVLRKQPEVQDATVIPLEQNGNAQAVAVLLLKVREPDAARRAVEESNRSLAEYQRMRLWVTWPEPDFPRTAAGKPRVAVIAARATALLTGQGDDAESSRSNVGVASFGASGAATGRISRLLEGLESSGSDGGDPYERATLNLSSLERVELMTALENRYHVELNETSFANAKTVSDVQELLRNPAAQPTDYVYPRWPQWSVVRWLRLAVYYALVWPATQILAHPKIVGREKLRGFAGPALIVSNHVTRRADIGLILAALPRRFRHRVATAIAGETLQTMRRAPNDWFFAKRWAYELGYWLVLALFNVFPLPRFSGFRESFHFAGESADRGYSILVFPEGEVTNSGEMAAFQPGIGLLVQNLRIPVVPMRLEGVWKMKREGRRLAHLNEVSVRIGEPIRFRPDVEVEEIARILEGRVRTL